MSFNSSPAPIGGWNARDPYDAMAPTDAIELINLFPNIASVDGRGGSVTKLTIAAGHPVWSVMPFTYATGSKLLAACNGNIWNIDTSAWTATSLASGFASDKWQYGHFNNHLVMVNGTDIPQVYDGTTFANINASLTGTPSNVVAALTAGNLSADTYGYRISAVLNSTESASSTEVTIAVPGPLTPPANTTFTQAGGSLATGTYYYRVTATNAQGETQPSAETYLAIAPLSTPSGASVVENGTHTGFLKAGTLYSYRVSAINSAGETLACAAVTFTPASNNAIAYISWSAVTGATGYKVYGRTSGSEGYLATVTGQVQYFDTGAATELQFVPSSNTTSGGVTVNWGAVTGATGYKVYGRSTGAELLMATITSGTTTTWTDNGTVTPSGAMPGSNTTGQGVLLTWDSIAGATGYNVYGRTVSGELKMTPTPLTVTTFTDDGSVTPSGALPTDTTTKIMVGTVNFKGRALYWTTNVCGFWYAAAGAFQGTLTYFPLDLVFHRGGSVQLIITWSRDNGDGVDDLCAIISTNGECVVYQGTDPGNALTWSLVGRFSIGTPLGVRSHGKLASAEILLTSDGFMSMDEAISNQRAQELQTFGGKIVLAANAAASAYGSNFGWEATHYPRGQMYIVNVPITSTQFEQYVRNTSTGSWCRFTGWNACEFCVYQDRLYFGTPDGKIVLADTSNSDTAWGYGDDGVEVLRYATQPFAHFNAPGMKAQLTGVQIVANPVYPTKLAANVFQDYQLKQVQPPTVAPESEYALWDVSSWDSVYWAGVENTSARPTLYSTVSHGFALALNLQYLFKGQKFSWYSTNYLFRPANGV
jgi:hypothetical protein